MPTAPERATDEAFLLDLLNTTPVVDDIQQDWLDRSWLRDHGHSGSTGEWHSARAARAALQDIVRGRNDARTLAPLLEDVRYLPAVTGDGVGWRLQTPTGRTAAVRAVLAWDELRRSRPGRLRACENTECALFLIDRSKPNRARWCSMAACGNRMKARRHYERTREADA